MLIPSFLVGSLLFSLGTFAQEVLCPTTFPEECTCIDNTWGPIIECITAPLDTWDIRATFDEITDIINNNDSMMQIVFLNATNLGQAQEVPANSISTLKTTSLYIDAQSKFTRIDPEAFSGCHSTLGAFGVYNMEFSNTNEIFDIVNNFKALQFLEVTSSKVSHIPAQALGADLQLRTVMFTDSSVTSVGDLAFYGPPFLDEISLAGNNLTLDEISNTAFEFVNQEVALRLELNPGITHLSHEIFGSFLSGNNMILVGCGIPVFCDPENFLHCDERMDWFCNTEKYNVYGYRCRESNYVDIYDYCEQTFGLNKYANQKSKVEYTKTAEFIERIQMKNSRAVQLQE